MMTSEKIAAIALAMAAAQGELKNPSKDKEAKIDSKTGAKFSYRYTDFATALEAIRPVMAKHKLAIVQASRVTDRDIVLDTRVIHESGEWIGGEYPVCPVGTDHRSMGSALSYARRYALFPLLGIQGEDEDDDGQADQDARNRHTAPAGTASKAQSRAAYEKLIVEMRGMQSAELLRDWLKLRRVEIEKMPEDWQLSLDHDYQEHKEGLLARVSKTDAFGLEPVGTRQ